MQEEIALSEYKQAETDLELYWRQRSRLQWQVSGDRNTAFYHLTATNRRRTNLIAHLKAPDGEILASEAQIRKSFVDFFKNLYCVPQQQVTGTDHREFFRQFEGHDYPKIGEEFHDALSRPPNELEVWETLAKMGPDKAPGPDGLTARLLQTHWPIFKDSLVKELAKALHSGRPLDEWMRCHIVLIPKCEDPETPKDFRPITIGNITYRLLMKILASRLQIHMTKLISINQTAFLKGRNIADNTILIKEILHSFQSPTYRYESFLLKADLAKAFDTVSWSFVLSAMEQMNIPPKIVELVKNCMSASKVTILVNGQGSGFLTPNRGLRQGCPLSPYLFIIVMEYLTRLFQQALQQGSLKGVQLAPTAPRLTHMLYADDVMVMGQADRDEISRVKGILDLFAAHTGLVINPDKSTIWYSERCDEEARELVTAEFGAKMAEDREKYLGIIVSPNQNTHDLTHNLLVDKVQQRLAGWKTNFLSHAGRLVLIKSVLLSLPVYYMSVAKLPKKTIQIINASIRRFLWGKMDRDKYISFIAWDKLCRDIEDGGLGVRDLKLFNEALLLKTVWQLASGQNKIWVAVMRAKYCPRKGIWGGKDARGASAMWRSVQQLKAFFKDDIRWHVGDGMGIRALNEPWFDEWTMQSITTNRQRDVSVADLFDSQGGGWNLQQIQSLIGAQAMQSIVSSADIPHQNPLIGDRLLWMCSKTGNYSVKEGYRRLAQQMHTHYSYSEDQHMAWKRIWGTKGVIPRVQFFLWRIVHGGLPTMAALHRRIATINPRCSLCGVENEYDMHVLFFCPIARATWFSSQLALRVSALPLSFPRAYMAITDTLNDEERTTFANLLWCIWKARNEAVFSAKKPSPQGIIAQVNQMTDVRVPVQQPQVMQRCQKTIVQGGSRLVLVDASWDQSTQAGWGMTSYLDKGELIAIRYGNMQVSDPLHAEAYAVLQVMQHILNEQDLAHGVQFVIYTDCANLVKAIAANDIEGLPSWNAAPTVALCAEICVKSGGRIKVVKVRREALAGPHKLANWARTSRRSFQGSMGEAEETNCSIDEHLDLSFFQIEPG